MGLHTMPSSLMMGTSVISSFHPINITNCAITPYVHSTFFARLSSLAETTYGSAFRRAISECLFSHNSHQSEIRKPLRKLTKFNMWRMLPYFSFSETGSHYVALVWASELKYSFNPDFLNCWNCTRLPPPNLVSVIVNANCQLGKVIHLYQIKAS